MGKVLVIKDADFSGNNVDIVPEYYNGSFVPTQQNYFQKKQLEISNNVWVYYGGSETLFYRMKSGTIVSIPPGQTFYRIINLVDTIGVSGESVDYANGQVYTNFRNNNTWKVKLKAPNDTYLAIFGGDYFPNGVSVIQYPGSRTLRRTSYDGYLESKYLRENGLWGDDSHPVGEYCTLFFNVFKGERINITSNASNGARACFMSYNTGYPEALPEVVTGQSRITMAAGQSQVLTVPQDCLLYVMNYSGNNDMFPSNITVIGV